MEFKYFKLVCHKKVQLQPSISYNLESKRKEKLISTIIFLGNPNPQHAFSAQQSLKRLRDDESNATTNKSSLQGLYPFIFLFVHLRKLCAKISLHANLK